MSTRIKVCGLTRVEDARHAALLGADILGLVLCESPRAVVAANAARWVESVRRDYPAVRFAGVFRDPTTTELREAIEELQLDLVQIHGASPSGMRGARWIRAVPDTEARAAAARMIDSWRGEERGGTPGSRVPRHRVVDATRPWALLVDSSGPRGTGGTGAPCDWSKVAGWRSWGSELPATRETLAESASPPFRLYLAGGLGPDNVGDAIRAVRPFGVDASSRLESAPGIKDRTLVTAFIDAVRSADHALREAGVEDSRA